MCEKGFDVPDIGLTLEQTKDDSDAFSSTLNECMTKVSGLTGDDDLTKGPNGREALVKGAQHLRDLGYDVEDPEPDRSVNIQDILQDTLNKCFSNPGGAE